MQFDSLWLNNTIWWHKSWPTLAQIMARCLITPFQYLNQCQLLINKVLWHLSESNFKMPNYNSLQWLTINATTSPHGWWVNYFLAVQKSLGLGMYSQLLQPHSLFMQQLAKYYHHVVCVHSIGMPTTAITQLDYTDAFPMLSSVSLAYTIQHVCWENFY